MMNPSCIDQRKIEVINYSVSDHPFRRWFSEALGTNDLEHLHELKTVTTENFRSRVEELRQFCESKIRGLQSLVKIFIDTEVVPRFGAIIGWQEVPTIRFHFSVNDPQLAAESSALSDLEPAAFLAKYYIGGHRVAMFHRDRDYGLPSGSINLWIPMTDVSGSNTLWLGGEGLQGRDAQPINLQNGQALFFDGANRWHGAIWNTSGVTRVSFDVRFVPSDISRNPIFRQQ
jgi:hypothetical protein